MKQQQLHQRELRPPGGALEGEDDQPLPSTPGKYAMYL
jgi:hypothetical protein